MPLAPSAHADVIMLDRMCSWLLDDLLVGEPPPELGSECSTVRQKGGPSEVQFAAVAVAAAGSSSTVGDSKDDQPHPVCMLAWTCVACSTVRASVLDVKR